MKRSSKKNIRAVETGGTTNPNRFGTSGRKIKKKIFNRICERADALVAVVSLESDSVEASASNFLDQYCQDWPRDRQRMVIQMAHLHLLDQTTQRFKNLKRGVVDEEIVTVMAGIDKMKGTSTTMEEMWLMTLDIAKSYAAEAEALDKYNLRLGQTGIDGATTPKAS